MPSRKDKSQKIHSVRLRNDLEDWFGAKIASQEIGSWTHAIEWGLTLLKDKMESKK